MALFNWFNKGGKKKFSDLLNGDAPVTLKDLLELDELQSRPEIVSAVRTLLQNPKHTRDAYDMLKYLATEGDAEAQYLLGDFCESALEQLEQAVIWYQRAADQGHAPAQRNYADMLMTGKGVPRDTRRASVYYEKAAKSGIPEAQFVMGELLRVGTEIPQELDAARAWYQRAAQNGYTPASERLQQMASGVGIQPRTGPAKVQVAYNELDQVPREQLMAEGLECFLGDKRPQDLKKAAEYVEMAAQKGLVDAQYMFGKMCMGGQGVEKNYQTALSWLEKAAAADHPEAAFEVARFYHSGVAVAKDETMAVQFLEKAASLGHSMALQAIRARKN